MCPCPLAVFCALQRKVSPDRDGQPPPYIVDACHGQDRAKTGTPPDWYHNLMGACCCAVSITVITATLWYIVTSGTNDPLSPSPPPAILFPTTDTTPTTAAPGNPQAAGVRVGPWWLVPEESEELLLVDNNEVRFVHDAMICP